MAASNGMGRGRPTRPRWLRRGCQANLISGGTGSACSRDKLVFEVHAQLAVGNGIFFEPVVQYVVNGDRDARRAQHADAVAKCDAIRQRLPAEYRRHALALRGLLRDLAEAEVAREQAEPLQEEFGAILPVEDELRRLVHVPEEIVSQETVTLWVIDGRVEPLRQDQQKDVQASERKAGKGYLYVGSTGSLDRTGSPLECTRRRFTRTRYRVAIATPWTAASLLNTVSLPAFDVHSEDFVTAEQFRSPHTALAHLERDLPEPAELARPVLERFEMVDDTPRDTESKDPFASLPLRSVA
ncbi:hypothetical protein PQI07_09075 [Methylobacterium sp. 092160098-2]|uniref:hypothetical protein n=1 Tax=Methylobacterium sp. 092160098-2 TaxID=3025129 RepID=UPI002381B748|nr:hypothetical protein [Methylobacterium sp. 092160098-2]MDE4910850.1 hypothetical protein [Methylobacterium sp. 092160098-2]